MKSKDTPVTDEEYQNLRNQIQVVATFLYDIGLGCLSSNIWKKIYFPHFRNLNPGYVQVYASPYIYIGFGKYYCNVSTYVPTEFSRSWITDHHILFVSFRIGHWELKVIPNEGKLYEIEFHRTGIDNHMSSEDIMSCCIPSTAHPGIKDWIDTFFYNQSERILYEQGIHFPCFTEIRLSKIQSLVQFLKMELDCRHMRFAYEFIHSGLNDFFVDRFFYI